MKILALPIMCVIFFILLVIFLVLFAEIDTTLRLRKIRMDKVLNKVQNLVAKGEYEEALQLLDTSDLYFLRYKMEPAERHEVTNLWIICQEKLGEVEIAVIELANTLTSYLYNSDVELWSQYLLTKWIALYKSCPPIHISRFYIEYQIEEGPIMRLGTIALLYYAIEEKGCQLPVGFDEEQWVIELKSTSAEEIKKFQQTLLGDMKVGDSLLWLRKPCAIVKRENGVVEKIKIS